MSTNELLGSFAIGVLFFSATLMVFKNGHYIFGTLMLIVYVVACYLYIENAFAEWDKEMDIYEDDPDR